jgi:hypothetical protein
MLYLQCLSCKCIAMHLSEPSEIIPYLYIGNHASANYLYHKFDLVVNCTKHLPFFGSNAKHIRVAIDDNPCEAEKLLKYVVESDVLNDIHSFVLNKKNVLVHCAQGVQRSPSLVTCYLMKYENLIPFQAMSLVQMKRPVAFAHTINFERTISLFAEHLQILQVENALFTMHIEDATYENNTVIL